MFDQGTTPLPLPTAQTLFAEMAVTAWRASPSIVRPVVSTLQARAVPVFDQLFSEVWVIRPSLKPDSPDVVAGRSGYAQELGIRGIYSAAGQGRSRDDAPALAVPVLGKRGNQLPAVRLLGSH